MPAAAAEAAAARPGWQVEGSGKEKRVRPVGAAVAAAGVPPARVTDPMIGVKKQDQWRKILVLRHFQDILEEISQTRFLFCAC